MDFWLEGNDDDGLAESQQQIVSQGTQNSAAAANSTNDAGLDHSLQCEHCGGTDFYHDDATGTDVCSSCFTQSQQQAPSQVMDDMDNGFEFEDMIQVAAKARGGHIVKRNSSGGGRGMIHNKNMSNRRPLSSYDLSRELPDLATCLKGLRHVIKISLQVLSRDLLDLNALEQAVTNDIAKHLLLSYLGSWGEGAEHFASMYPEMRFSLRDQFLSNPYRRAVHCVLLEKAIKQAKTEEQQEQGLSGRNYLRGVFPADPRPKNNLPGEKGSVPANNQNERHVEKTKRTSYALLIRKIVNQGGRRSTKVKGNKEAALVLQPGMKLVAAVLWLTVCRRGVSSSQMVNWICNGALPLRNAFDSCFKNHSNLRELLKPAEVAFRMNLFPSITVLESYGSLLLVAAGLKSHDIFAGGASLPPGRLQNCMIRTLSVTAIPVTTAQLVADLGLPQSVLDAAFALMGLIPATDRFAKDGMPRPLKHAAPEKIHSISHVAAIIMCAVEMQPGWRKMFLVRRMAKHSSSPLTTTASSSSVSESQGVPLTEGEFRMMTCGSCLDRYIQFCDELFPRCKRKFKSARGLNFGIDSTSSIEPFEEPDEYSQTRLEPVRPCSFTASNVLSETALPPSLLQRRIFHMTMERGSKKRKRLVDETEYFPLLDPNETLLLEFLAYATRTIPSKIQRALISILGYSAT
ncbi:hypothetical protein ACA910_001691 [Epithemia clementina (nom. ined.)]